MVTARLDVFIVAPKTVTLKPYRNIYEEGTAIFVSQYLSLVGRILIRSFKRGGKNGAM